MGNAVNCMITNDLLRVSTVGSEVPHLLSLYMYLAFSGTQVLFDTCNSSDTCKRHTSTEASKKMAIQYRTKAITSKEKHTNIHNSGEILV